MEPMTKNEIEKLHKTIPDWEIKEVDGVPHLTREFKFKNFAEALAFTNQIGEIAENGGHHPLITLTWGRVKIDWWTHDIQGLSENDFAMAAKTDEAFEA
jgi:4a-hydroxytetrahydrobiopterin dehydratase